MGGSINEKYIVKIHLHDCNVNDKWIRYSMATINLEKIKNVNECIQYFPLSTSISHTQDFTTQENLKTMLLHMISNTQIIFFAADHRTQKTVYNFTQHTLSPIKNLISDFPMVFSQNDIYEQIDKNVLSYFVNDSENIQFDVDQFWLETYIAYKFFFTYESNI